MNRKAFATAFCFAAIAALSLALPYVLNVDFISLKVSCALFFVSSLIVLLSPYLYTSHLVQGTAISLVFMSVGYLLPLIFIEISNEPILHYLASNNLILLPTFFGNIGLCLYVFILAQNLSKIVYKLKNKGFFI